MRVLIGIQARTNSTRLKGKIYKKIGKKSMLKHVYETCKRIKVNGHEIMVIILGPVGDEKLQAYCGKNMMELICVDFNESDVLTRYVVSARIYKADAIVRVTSDCPFVNQQCIEKAIEALETSDYVSGSIIRSFAEGVGDVQGASARALQWFDKNQIEQREHPFVRFDENAEVRMHFVKDGFSYCPLIDRANIIFQKNSVDTKDDLKRAQAKYAGQ